MWSRLRSCFRRQRSQEPRPEREPARVVVPEPPAAPPASEAALRRLARVRCRDTDEKDCSICLEPLGETALRMPCGHQFHEACVLPWLRLRCFCPCCRFEIGTDDPSFERGRLRRNAANRRFVKIRRTELSELPVRALKDLLAAAGEDASRCFERSDLVEAALRRDSNVVVVEDRFRIARGRLMAMSVSSLLTLAKQTNLRQTVDFRTLTEKEDLRNALLQSPDLLISHDDDQNQTDDPLSTDADVAHDDDQTDDDEGNNDDDDAPSSSASPKQQRQQKRSRRGREDELSVGLL